MKHTATAPPAYRSRRRRRRSLAAYGFPYPPTARTITRQGTTRNDACPYNNGSVLISDVVDGTGLNGWDYDLAAAASSSGVASKRQLSPNRLNQYTAIEDQAHDVFTPTYDDDGNQTRVKTGTGIWNVTYNAKNRPVLFTKDDNSVSVECTYDYMGRRATKKVTENGTVTLHQRYLYRGYLQIACCDLLRPAHPCIWLITWDPTQPIATRPLAIQKDGTWYTYGWDLTKNIWEAYNTSGYIGTAYTYTAYGQVTANGAVEQPIQWSSEYNDDELGLVHYNYRHYNPVDGRWIGRDPREQPQLYTYAKNVPEFRIDYRGEFDFLNLDLLIRYLSFLRSQEVYDTDFLGTLDSGETLTSAIKRHIDNIVMPRVRGQIQAEVEREARNQREDTGTATLSKPYTTLRTYDFIPVLFALGDGTVKTYSIVTYTWEKLCGCLFTRIAGTWNSHTEIHYRDIFEDIFNIGVEVGNNYTYFHIWEEIFDGSFCIDPDKKSDC